MIITVLNDDGDQNQQSADKPDWKQMKEAWKTAKQQWKQQHKEQKEQGKHCGKEWSEEDCMKKAKHWKHMIGGFFNKMGFECPDFDQS